MNYLKKAEKYFAKHTWYNGFVHVLAGMGIGILITYPVAGSHPVRWGLALLGLAILGHLWPLIEK